MHDLILTLFGDGQDLNALQMSMRALAVFVLTLTMIRVSGRRSVGQHRAFDACTTVLLGSVLSRAVVGVSPFWPTMAAGAMIVVLHRIIAMASLRWPWFESMISGDKRELVRQGRRDEEEMRKALITGRDLDEAVRKRSGDERSPVDRAVLERDGQITVRLAQEDSPGSERE
jgi:uncharacterized membrane protein YcaP (DUF421 family)